MKRGGSKNPIAFVVLIVSVSCLFVLILSILRLPDVSFSNGPMTSSFNLKKITKLPENDDDKIGKFGEMMIKMLPQDLPFTIFVPSEFAFGRDLKLRVNNSLAREKADDTYATLTRILSFTVVPWKILSESLSYNEEITCDSLSGFKLHVSKDADKKLVVNSVRSSGVDLRIGEMVIHVMDGVLMEAEFEQSVRSDEDDD